MRANAVIEIRINCHRAETLVINFTKPNLTDRKRKGFFFFFPRYSDILVTSIEKKVTNLFFSASTLPAQIRIC